MNHTKGPWKVFETENGWSVRPADTEHTVTGSMGGYSNPPIAKDVCGFNWRGTKHEANARLIAAAPELFEALKLVITHDEDLMDKIMRNPKRDTLAWRIKCAIAKADPGYFPGFTMEDQDEPKVS